MRLMVSGAADGSTSRKLDGGADRLQADGREGGDHGSLECRDLCRGDDASESIETALHGPRVAAVEKEHELGDDVRGREQTTGKNHRKMLAENTAFASDQIAGALLGTQGFGQERDGVDAVANVQPVEDGALGLAVGLGFHRSSVLPVIA